MSAPPPTAEVPACSRHVGEVPEPDVRVQLTDAGSLTALTLSRVHDTVLCNAPDGVVPITGALLPVKPQLVKLGSLAASIASQPTNPVAACGRHIVGKVDVVTR
jgi:hypothetical protein